MPMNLGLGLGLTNRAASGSAPPPALILDTLTPQRAYSLRKLRTAYAGAAIRVRRSSDNTEQDIGFSGTDLDTAALLAFAGSGSAFIRTFYDQMGNVDWVQTTQADQPRIVNAGVLETEGGLPVIGFTDNTTQHLTQAPFLYASGAMTVLAVAKSAAAVPRGFIGEFGGGTPNYSFRSGSGAANSLRLTLTNDAGTAVVPSSALDGTVWDGVTRSIVIKDTGSVCNSFDNGAIGSTINYTRSGVLTLTLLVVGGLAGNINSLPLRLHEVIIFSSAISNADQNTIALNQGGAYGITVNPI